MEKETESITKRIIVWAVVIMSASTVALLILEKNKQFLRQDVLAILYIIIMAVSCTCILLAIALGSIAYIKLGIHNIKTSGDELFAPIDTNRRRMEEGEFYKNHILIIKCVYNSKEMKHVVKNKDLKRLYARLDFLDKNATLYSDALTCLMSITVSFFVALITETLDLRLDVVGEVAPIANILNMFFQMIIFVVILLILFFVCLLKYYKRGQEGAYKYQTDKCERELLVKKINKIEKSIKVNKKHQEAILTKQIIIGELIERRKTTGDKGERKEIERDLQRLEQLNLCLSDYKETHIRRLLLNKQEICLIYNKKKKKDSVTKYIGNENLVNQEYVVLYEILKRNEYITV